MGQGPDPLAEELLAVATRLARRAGRLLLSQGVDRTAVATKSSPTDVVTAADTAAERLIRSGLQVDRPDDGLLAEEGGGWPGRGHVRWVVDPLDGTVNYLYGIPQFAVSLAAEVAGRARVGVVYDPNRDELFTAVSGQGARCNDRPLRGSDCAELGQALVATGFSYTARRRARQARLLTRVLPRVRDIRRQGAASLDLCAAAAGRVDAFFEAALSPWDRAAGQLIATEAGLEVASRRVGPDEVLLAAPRALFPALADLLAVG